MRVASDYVVERWSAAERRAALGAVVLFVVLAAVPTLCSGQVIDKLTTLFVYILLAAMWNLLSGYAGLVSVGQQAYFGVGAYFALRLVSFGIEPYPALLLGALVAAAIAVPVSFFLLRLRDGEFAIASWVVAEVIRILVMFDFLVQGETGTSLIALNSYDPGWRLRATYWFALVSLAGLLFVAFLLLRSRIGAAGQAIRDDEEAARSLGVNVMRTKQTIYVLAAFGCALAGVIWLASAITFLPRTNFGVQWTVFMLFMVLVGGLRTMEGPILGAVIFFVLQEGFGNYGVWYLFGIGIVAVVFALALPGGIWGAIHHRFGARFFPVGERLVRRGVTADISQQVLDGIAPQDGSLKMRPSAIEQNVSSERR
ncbi:branched-chain amino acid ABC transporter permease [Bradyrhizobium manausense]|uniref:branched-chain amino acid ABC transporter permease n=1 Tax=Bradyrhizobium manausense TaxID=989370 RepID=UPI001BAAFCC3|nr:branched-chain amino acid ABC transporter permease [Bradyrhizobium manausense]MBR0687798.1 branched-chain amino acid ABC transporter permease [Bradyrhizobium manausense]